MNGVFARTPSFVRSSLIPDRIQFDGQWIMEFQISVRESFFIKFETNNLVNSTTVL